MNAPNGPRRARRVLRDALGRCDMRQSVVMKKNEVEDDDEKERIMMRRRVDG